jgi:Ca-activated chloride channel family protein
VRPDEDIEERVARLYNRISSPVLQDVKFTVSNREPGTVSPNYGTNRVYPSESFDLFAGEQLVIVGRYSKPGNVVVTVEGKIGENAKHYTFDASLIERSNDQSLSFIARLWAMRRIGEILDQLDLKGQNDELVKELVGLSTRYGILTPYTSFLADENTVLTDRVGALARSKILSSNLNVAEGELGVAQRAAGGQFRSATQDNVPASAPALAMRTPAQPQPGGGAGAGGRAGGGAGGMGMGGGGMGGFGGAGGGITLDRIADAKAKEEAAESNVQRIGDRAFFQKGGVWIDSTLTEEQQKPANVTVVKQFSEEYFKLIEQYDKKITPYLALGGTQLINIDGKAYRVEPSRAADCVGGPLYFLTFVIK